MEYKLQLTERELEVMAQILQQWPYITVKPILEKIWKQIDEQIQNLDTKKE